MFYKFKRRKEFVVPPKFKQGVLIYYELTAFAVRRDGEDAIVIFEVAAGWTV
jgi:hypothetical protein